MRKSCFSFAILAMALLAATPAGAQSFSGFLRSLSNTLSGGSDKPAPVQNNAATATIGVRGMDDENVASNAPASPESLKALDGWAATSVDAEIAAGKRGLVANKNASYGELATATAASAPTAEAATQEDAQ